jgi:Zn-dependent protease with chaperone function
LLVNHTAWLAQRAMLAIALMVGFYLLALAIAIGLLWIPYAEWVYADRIHPKIALFCIGSAGALLWAVIPRPDRFSPPGPRLDESSHGALFAVIRKIAAATRQEMPADVYLVNDVNAWVTHRGGIMGIGSRRVMGLGLPLVQGLTVTELEAVLAHEFGHYAAGDVKLGPWIYKTRAAIGRTLAGLGDSWLSSVFNAYGNMFLRLTHAISREQEFMADALAARTVHPAAMTSALRRVEGLAPAFSSYWRSEVAPALNAGYLPPIATGFSQYLVADPISAAVRRLVSTAATTGEAGAYDTHPPLRERLEAIARLPISKPPRTDDPSALTLLRDAEAHARMLLEFAAGRDEVRKLRQVQWADLATQVYPAQWRETASRFAPFLSGFTADGLPADRAGFVTAGRTLVQPGEGDDDARVARAAQVLALGIAVALLDAGAEVETSPGHPVVFRLAGASVDPFTAVRDVAEGTLPLAEWQAQCRLAGIAGMTLGHPAAA